MSGILGALAGGAGFKPITRIYTAVGAGTETIPPGARFLTVELWGGGGSGGGGTVGSTPGAGGGGGAYLRTNSILVSGGSGKTINYTVGNGGAAITGNGLVNGNAGGASSISSGTFTITSKSANPGGAGNGANNAGGAGGTGGAAGTGDAVNTAGFNGQSSAGGGNGASAVTGLNGSGGAGGGGAPDNVTPSTAGNAGRVVFIYT